MALAPTYPSTLPAWWLVVLAVACALVRPVGTRGGLAWLTITGAIGALAGAAIGTARLEAIDGHSLRGTAGTWVQARGVVTSPPRIAADAERFVLHTREGKVLVETEPDSGTRLGGEATVAGPLQAPADWQRPQVERFGAAMVLHAERVEPGPGGRGGIAGALDEVRSRAEEALASGTGAASSALLRGFVLGQDDRITEPVREDFRRSGLAHVLAVSGQNVMLLALLAAPLLALAGVRLRARLLLTIALIALYVPVAGAGPSIQRAGVMGAAGLMAALAGRPSTRWYALLLAAIVTLTVDPRATADVGWQLSFAAVVGLLVLTRPLVERLGGERGGPARIALREGLAMTIAATITTAPLAAHHFGTLSLTAIPANLLALPAIAPAMWLGMLSAGLGQLPWAPVEAFTFLGGLCAGYVGWVAHLFGGAGAQLELDPPTAPTTAALIVAGLLIVLLACSTLARRGKMRIGPRERAAAVIAVLAVVAIQAIDWGGSADNRVARPDLLIRVLDVGQGDAILLEPRGALPLLVDTGAPGSGAAERLRDLGIDALGAVLITHDQRDHSGALADVLQVAPAERVITAENSTVAACSSRTACPLIEHVGVGSVIRHGSLRLDVLWPPTSRETAGVDPNARSLVLRARSGRFDALLTGDGEAEVAHARTGPVEVLKVAHHGSEDAGLPRLLSLTRPAVAAISVGAGNSFGHPAQPTLDTLAAAGVAVMRTDEHGEIVLAVDGGRWSVE